MPALSAGIISLVLAYMLSQFYRAFLAVLTPVLGQELQISPADLALSSGLWFIAFAVMQLPIGWSLDRFGPRRTVAVLLALGGGGGAAIFALATTAWQLHLSMTLLGIGCSPALMGPYYIFAREYPVSAFGSLAGMVVAVGALGNILGASPLVWAIEAIGWRATLWWLTAATLAVAGLIALSVRDPQRLDDSHPGGSVIEVLRLRALWFLLPLFFVNYAASAAIRGLWAAPYLDEVFNASEQVIGRVTLAMGLGMVLANLAIGPVVRLVGSIRRAALIFTGATLLVLLALVLFPDANIVTAAVLMTLIGLSGTGYTLVMAHGRSFLPPHLLGRGVTCLNMFSIGGVWLMQFASRPVYQAASAAYPAGPAFAMLFLFFLIPLAIGFALYFLTPEAEYA